MKTPVEYNELIKENKITLNILGEVIHSFNKRAKNYRDKIREYKKLNYRKFDNIEQYEDKKEEYYKIKADILSKVSKPTKIHLERKTNTFTYKVYDCSPDYFEVDTKDTIREGQYFDRDLEQEVHFKVIEGVSHKDLYYLYYEVGNYSFHQPIREEHLGNYEDEDIDIETITNFKTIGRDINDLLSTQFCNKVYTKLMNDELEII